MPAKLFLIPTALSDEIDLATIPPYINSSVSGLRIFLCEEEKSARRFLKKICPDMPLPECTFFPYNEHAKSGESAEFLKSIKGKDLGLLSEAGCPCVADPGADVVLWAHQEGMEVIPLIGPSSIVLALMGSGLNGQNFAFNGYLPKEQAGRIQKIKELERRSAAENQTQIFIEAPYRNQHVLEDILSVCQPETLLSLAVNLAASDQMIKTLTLKEWKSFKPDILKKPVVFLLQGKRLAQKK